MVSKFLEYAARLKFKKLFLLTAGLFLFDVLVPDFIPLVDELLLGLLTLLFATVKKKPPENMGKLAKQSDE